MDCAVEPLLMDSELVDRNRRNGRLRIEAGTGADVSVCPFQKRNRQPNVLFLASAGVRSLHSRIYPFFPVACKTLLDADRSAFRIRCSVVANLELQLRQIERRVRSAGATFRLKFDNAKKSGLLNNPSLGDFLAGSLATGRRCSVLRTPSMLTARQRTPNGRTPRKPENNPSQSYNPSSDADGSDLEPLHKC